MRKLIVAILASSTFGGVIGALATAATQSQASPAAIAVAVQHVQDQSAENSLTGINGRLTTVTNRLNSVLTSLNPSGFGVGYQLLNELKQLNNNLYSICQNTRSSTVFTTCHEQIP